MTNFQRFLFSTGFSYVLLVVSELIRFFADYLLPGSTLQHYDLNEKPHLLFFKVFGYGKAENGQLALLATDLRYFYFMLGAMTAGIVLLSVYERKSRIEKDHNGLFSEYSPGKTPLNTRRKYIIHMFQTELSVREYLLWWGLRGLMIWAALQKRRQDPSDFSAVLLIVNLTVTFLLPLIRLVFLRTPFFGRLPLRLQSYIDVFVFFGSFLNHGCEINGIVDNYDKYLHMLMGGLCVRIGYLLIRSTRRSDRLSPGVCAAASGGFSCVVSVVWEIFEFFADYFRQNSMNQNWEYRLKKQYLFVRIFGFGAGNPGQGAVVDTNLDILCGFGFCGIFTLLLYGILKARAAVAADAE
ncbi:MAG: hypothetical protein IK118_01965 [Clostridia bacterium]|nr:hypothetical protein [Clostridia bacterium]